MAIGIGITIAVFDEDRNWDRDLNFGDRAHALNITTYCTSKAALNVKWTTLKIARNIKFISDHVSNPFHELNQSSYS